MPETQKKIKELANKIRDFESEEDLKDIIRLLKMMLKSKVTTLRIQ